MKDCNLVMENTDHFMSLWRISRPVICKINEYALAGGSDLALCSDLIFMEETREIGYMPSRVWGARKLLCWFIKLEYKKHKECFSLGIKLQLLTRRRWV